MCRYTKYETAYCFLAENTRKIGDLVLLFSSIACKYTIQNMSFEELYTTTITFSHEKPGAYFVYKRLDFKICLATG